MDDYIDGMLTIWYILTVGSLAFLIYDLATNTPTGRVMKLAWFLVILYTGPVGLFIYILSCRQPLPGMHDAYIATHWKQAVGSLLHCVAGDATGIIISATIVYHFGLANGADLIIEYLSAFIVGLFVFQALFMRAMYGGSYWLAVRKTFFAETVSMNMVMIGMFPTMVILMHLLPDASSPYHPLFWGVMSFSTLMGMITAYPINSWMVARGLKHGMMSAIAKPNMSKKMDLNMDSSMGMDSSMDMNNMKHSKTSATLTMSQALTIQIATFFILGLALWITNQYAPIVFT